MKQRFWIAFLALLSSCIVHAEDKIEDANSKFIDSALCKSCVASDNSAIARIDIKVKTKNVITEYTCSGVLVSSYEVYTAKHCVSLTLDADTSLLVVFDEGIKYEVDIIIIDHDSDLAVLRLKKHVKEIKPINLSQIKTTRDDILVGSMVAFGCFKKRDEKQALFWLRDDSQNKLDVFGCVCHGDSGGALLDAHGNLLGIIIGTREDGFSGTALLLNKRLIDKKM